MVEGSMTQGAGQEPVVRTATLRDFRVPPYARVPVQGHATDPTTTEPLPVPPPAEPAPPEHAPVAVPAAAVAAVGAAGPTASVPVAAPAVPTHAPAVPTHAPAEPTLHLGRRTPPAYAPASAPTPNPAPAPASSTATGSSIVSVATGHPGNAFPEGGMPEGYTPTERDLPVINRGDTVQVPVAAEPTPAAEPAPTSGEGPGPLFVVGDVHGYLDELVEALRAQGLIDENGSWAAGNARLWFLGDFTDRGPDGIGVIDLVMRLSAEAAAAGGYCKALMGNHELLLIGAKRFGDTPVNSGAGTATFQAAWLLNGGQKHDMDRLQDVHLQWMSRLDAVVREDDHLLLHSDTTAYLDYGQTIEDVNDTVHEILNRNDADEVWDVFRKFTKRFAFRDEGGPQAVQELLSTYGGSRIVHGHSPIPYLLGQVGTEDGEGNSGPLVDGPHVYADGLAIAMDGGVTMAGKLLVVQLPLNG
ncbi:metallophosphoesterase [Streptomyces sp. TX20-6-3]|uniref:metallophosphoesterase n=1 Tax=Streptomyces sp. TX20-6-3 TaxID=3028705 RepID=UPI0029B46635|nr:metallophosphoesterase [Streptomyces sp. TX20-6-3]MDX2562365.1 metallophosphoesterase [Streptomyces sp. TX20-6-3]